MDSNFLGLPHFIWASIISAIGGIISKIIAEYRGIVGIFIYVFIFVGLIIGFTVGFSGSVVLSQILTPDHTLTINAPFDVGDYFIPSGWMGDGEAGAQCIQLNTSNKSNLRIGDKDNLNIKINYTLGAKGWAGIYWQYPDKNWGDIAGIKIGGAKRIIFWAKGENGGEVVEFKAGGINDPNKKFKDSFTKPLGKRTLSTEWQKYEIDLKDENLSHVIGAFAWIAAKDGNPNGLTCYLDEIRYEK